MLFVYVLKKNADAELAFLKSYYLFDTYVYAATFMKFTRYESLINRKNNSKHRI